MRNLFALLMVAGMFAFVSCEQKTETSEAQTEGDTTTVVAPEETAPVAPDTTTAPAAGTDTTTAPAAGQEQMKH